MSTPNMMFQYLCCHHHAKHHDQCKCEWPTKKLEKCMCRRNYL